MHFRRRYGITHIPSRCNITRTKQINAVILSHYPIYVTYHHQSCESHSTASYLLASHWRETDLIPGQFMSDLRWTEWHCDRLWCNYFSCQYHSTYASHPINDITKSHTHTHAHIHCIFKSTPKWHHLLTCKMQTPLRHMIHAGIYKNTYKLAQLTTYTHTSKCNCQFLPELPVSNACVFSASVILVPF